MTNQGAGLRTVPQLAQAVYDWVALENFFNVAANFLNVMNVQLFDSPGENGLLDWNCKVWERFMCDDDITYINTVMGSYMFNSEFLYNSGNMPAIAKPSSSED